MQYIASKCGSMFKLFELHKIIKVKGIILFALCGVLSASQNSNEHSAPVPIAICAEADAKMLIKPFI
jgi:hypothetical protein